MLGMEMSLSCAETEPPSCTPEKQHSYLVENVGSSWPLALWKA